MSLRGTVTLTIQIKFLEREGFRCHKLRSFQFYRWLQIIMLASGHVYNKVYRNTIVLYPIILHDYAFIFNCTTVAPASDSVKGPDHNHLSQQKRLLYLSYRRPVKTMVSLRIRAVSPEPSLFAHMKY